MFYHIGGTLFYLFGGKFANLSTRAHRRVRMRRRAGLMIPSLGPALGRAFSRVSRVVRESLSLLAFSPLDHFYPPLIRLSERYVINQKFEIKEIKGQNNRIKLTA